jgi:hypothetical protein
MERFTVVSAIYNIYPTLEYRNILWERVAILSQYFHVVLFCSATDAERAASVANITPIFMELCDTQTYKLLSTATRIPEQRNMEKDTHEYLKLINSKVEFMKLAAEIVKPATDFYMWLDAGLSKVMSSPAVFSGLRDSLSTYDSNAICIPGPWPKFNKEPHEAYVRGVYWRFCGGHIIIPRAHVVSFFEASLEANRILIEKTGGATWEVMVWAYIESRMPDKSFRIQWVLGDHNDSMFTNIIPA